MDVAEDNKTAKKLKTLKKWVVFVLILFTLSLLIFRFVLIPGNVPSASMEPTLMTGDIIFVNGLAYDTHDPQRGDIIAFHSQELGCVLIKRIIGMPGDKVSFEGNSVNINGEPLNESYLTDNVGTKCGETFTVPADSYFVLGDNRENSLDSRFWKDPFVSRKSIMGRYFGRLNF